MPKVLIDGNYVDVGTDAIFNDDQTPLTIPTGRVFSEDDVARIREEEKNKLYGTIDGLRNELTGFKETVGSLTAAEQRREAQAKEELAQAEAAARAKENEELDAKTLLAKREEEWRAEQARITSDWEQRFEAQQAATAAAEAARQKEREFNDLREYAQAQVTANTERIAPQLLGWITGNSREEIDAAIARAVETTDALVADMQQSIQQYDAVTGQPIPVVQAPPAPPATPGTRVTAAPGSDPGAQFQTLTAEQIAQMPMDEYAKLRGTLGIGGQSSNRGLYG